MHLLGEVDALEIHLPQLQPPSPTDVGSGVVSSCREGTPGYIMAGGGVFLGGSESANAEASVADGRPPADAGSGGCGLPSR